MMSIGTRAGTPRAARRKAEPRGECLEDRRLMAADPGYVLSGLSWPDPGHITFSFPPDGVAWDAAPNALNSAFDARFGAATWRREVARALQTWATVANLNVVPVGDVPLGFDVPGRAQGDPRFGDIRIGGFDFHDPSTLAQTYPPPPGGLTSAGDSEVNTGANWNLGGDYDLYSVMLHEMGLALGLAETTAPGPVMSGYYNGVRAGLTPQDVAGIRAIYGSRVPDAFQIQGRGITAADPVDLTAGLVAGRGSVGGLSLVSIGDTELFRVVAPAGATGLRVEADAAGISLLSPEVNILGPALATLAAGGDPAAYGNNASAALSQVVPGQAYLIAVTGATRDVFAVGAYHLQVAFTGSPQSPPPPQSPAVRTIAPDRFEPNDSAARPAAMGAVLRTTISNLSISSPGDVDVFAFRAARAGTYQASAPGLVLTLLDGSGRTLGQATGTIRFRLPKAGVRFAVAVSAAGGATAANYSLAIGPVAPAAAPRRGAANGPRGPMAAFARRPGRPR